MPATAVPIEDQIRVIEPGRIALRTLGRDMWAFRELLYFLTWRDVKIRYKQTVLGVLWAVLQPVGSMVVLSIFFGRLAGLNQRTGGTPYPIFVYAGLLPWTFFANTLAASCSSVVGNAGLVTKIRFPRIFLPLAAVTAGLVDLGIAFLVLGGMMAWYHVPLTGRILWAPLLVVGISAAAAGVGFITAALTVTYRDVRYVLPFITQLWMFMTPVIYPSSVVPARWQWLFSMNPLTGWIGGFRAVFLGQRLPWSHLALSALTTLGILMAGIYYFRAAERRFADVI